MEYSERSIYNRTLRLLGEEAMTRLGQVKVLVVGVGGVGGWCAEGLLRSGITHITIVDSDRVSVTNINRQVVATTKTVGRVKVEALKEHLLEINPHAQIVALQKIYCDEDHESFCLDDYDYIIDAVDSLKDKVSLILRATSSRAVFFSSMGAALKVDPTNVKVAEFWKVQGCPLAAMLRKRIKHLGQFPAKKFMCVYDPEVCDNLGPAERCPEEFGNLAGEGDADLEGHDWSLSKAQVNGTMVHVVAIFGMTLAGLVVKHAITQLKKQESEQ